MVSSNGMLVNKEWTSKLAIQRSLFWVKISSRKVKEYLSVKLFCVISDRTRTKNFASLYVGVPIAERMCLNGDNPFLSDLCTLVVR